MFRLGLLSQCTIGNYHMVEATETSAEVRQTLLRTAGLRKITDFSLNTGGSSRKQVGCHVIHALLIAGDEENGRLCLLGIDAGGCTGYGGSCSQNNDPQWKPLNHS